MVCLFMILFISQGYSQAEKKTAVEQQIKKLSNDWMIAAKNRDEKTLQQIVAPEFKLAGTNLDQAAVPREVWMKNTMEHLKIDSINYTNMMVDVVDNVAIVQSKFYWTVTFRDMPKREDTAHLIDTWIKRESGWQVVSRLMVD